jgi:Ca2+-binding RTX toxin-like protein
LLNGWKCAAMPQETIMASFWTYGRSGVVMTSYDALALSSSSFFDHQLLYASNGSYSDTLVRGAKVELGIFGDRTFTDELTGTGFTVETLGDFALTGGEVTGYFEESTAFGRGFFGRWSVTASGFSIAAATFWDLASTGQWQALWDLAAAGNDGMTGSNVAAYADFIEGGAGNDMIFAQAGNDNLWGEEGADGLWGGAGSDYLNGGDDSDALVGNEWVSGVVSDLWDGLHGDAGDDYLFTGGYGHALLDGGAGSDRMWGGPDSDFLTGGAGIDYLAGGGGRDIFEVTAADNLAGEYDFIRDFQDRLDFIKLPAGVAWYVANSNYGAIISAPGTGFYLIVQYATAALVSDQIYYA